MTRHLVVRIEDAAPDLDDARVLAHAELPDDDALPAAVGSIVQQLTAASYDDAFRSALDE